MKRKPRVPAWAQPGTWSHEWLHGFEEALREGGCTKPRETAVFLRDTVYGNNHTKLPRRSGIRVKPSTLSTRFGNTEIRPFLHEINTRLELLAKDLAKRFPADSVGYIAIDDYHEEQYWEPYKIKGRVRPERRRTQVSVKPAAKNKASNKCHRWAVLALSWRHKGRKIIVPVQVDLLPPIGQAADQRMEVIADTLVRLGLPIRVLLLDRYYDSGRARNIAAEHGIPIGGRVKVHRTKFKRWLTTPDGQRLAVQDLLKDLVKDDSVPIRDWRHPIKGEVTLQKSQVVVGRFKNDCRDYSVLLSAGLKPGASGGWELDMDRTVVACFPLGTGPRAATQYYRRRWRIEAFFRDISDDRGSSRCQTIQSHAIRFTAFLYRCILGGLMRFCNRVMGVDGPETLMVAAREVIGLDAFGRPLDLEPG